jgi:hypothetical protein
LDEEGTSHVGAAAVGGGAPPPPTTVGVVCVGRGNMEGHTGGCILQGCTAGCETNDRDEKVAGKGGRDEDDGA